MDTNTEYLENNEQELSRLLENLCALSTSIKAILNEIKEFQLRKQKIQQNVKTKSEIQFLKDFVLLNKEKSELEAQLLEQKLEHNKKIDDIKNKYHIVTKIEQREAVLSGKFTPSSPPAVVKQSKKKASEPKPKEDIPTSNLPQELLSKIVLRRQSIMGEE